VSTPPAHALIAIDDAIERVAVNLGGPEGAAVRRELAAVRAALASGDSIALVASIPKTRAALETAAVDPVMPSELAAIDLALDATRPATSRR
jgi:hypothetical protein